MGCGRMFEGTPEPMWAGLERLRALPGETLIYCGHEYTKANAKFALSLEPGNAALKIRAAEVDAAARRRQAHDPREHGDREARPTPSSAPTCPSCARR